MSEGPTAILGVLDRTEREVGKEVVEWGKRAKKGFCCGIFGCQGKDLLPCPSCTFHYCRPHSRVHVHIANESHDDGSYIR